MENSKTTLLKIGKNIAELRKKKGYTQKQLAKIIFVGEKTVSKWERGIVVPDITMIKTLSTLFEISIDELLNGPNVNVSDNDVVDVIKVYSNQTKHDVIVKFLYVFGVLALIFTVIFFINEYYSWDFKTINIDGEFKMSGYLIKNHIETKLIINNIVYDDLNAGTDKEVKTNYFKISLYSDDVELCTDINNFDEETSLYEILNKYTFVCERNEKTNVDNLVLHLDYYIDSILVKKEIRIL